TRLSVKPLNHFTNSKRVVSKGAVSLFSGLGKWQVYSAGEQQLSRQKTAPAYAVYPQGTTGL
ncbi:MAG: hypothetical protein ACYC21_07960, partial [Eubacteriales bacterium]